MRERGTDFVTPKPPDVLLVSVVIETLGVAGGRFHGRLKDFHLVQAELSRFSTRY